MQRLAELAASICAKLIGKVAALPGFEAIAKVAFPPPIGLVEVTHFHLIGLRMLRKPVPKSEMAVKAHELAKINVGDSRVTSNDQHVLVIIRSGSFTKVCLTGND